MNLQEVLRLTVERIPTKLAIVGGSRRLSYEEWGADIYSLANSLRDIGMGSGDRVVVLMGNTVPHATVTTAVVVGGGVTVPYNSSAAPMTIAQVIEDAEAKAVVTDSPMLREELTRCGLRVDGLRWVYAGEGGPQGPESGLDLDELIKSGSSEHPDVDIGTHQVANILYTSGTTGLPKGIPHTHDHIYERMLAWVLHFGPVISGGVRSLGVSPLYHIVGLHCVLWLTVLENGSYHLPERRNADALLTQIESERITFIAASPTMLDRLLGGAEQRSFDLSSVNTVVPGSAPRPPHLMEGLRKIFPYARFGEAYGTSEGVMLGAVDLFEKPGAFQVVGDAEVRVVRPGGMPNDILDDDVEGELIVRTSSSRLVNEYWKRPEETSERYRHGWFYTGDAVRRDSDGDIWVVGRLDDMFISGAENIQPTEIEVVLNRHPDINDCAVIGTPDREWGELCTAFIVCSPQLSVGDIDKYCREASDLAEFKRPRRYVFVEGIERNSTGKIMRKEYRQAWIEGKFETVKTIR